MTNATVFDSFTITGGDAKPADAAVAAVNCCAEASVHTQFIKAIAHSRKVAHGLSACSLQSLVRQGGAMKLKEE